jgi:hypothetical protein
MARILKKPGSVFAFPTEKGEHGYCQWLPHLARVFRVSTTDQLSLEQILELPEAFAVMIFGDTPGRYGWQKIGSGPYPQQYEERSWFAKQDIITGKITRYRAGLEEPATYEEVRDLETVAAWAHPHIVERLMALLRGEESSFLHSVRIKPTEAQQAGAQNP